uniref:MOSC domain-containing protein n=1 Tax=Opuntia streptacantha TaxID=393608 RepID=A0A7C9F011_OPUST
MRNMLHLGTTVIEFTPPLPPILVVLLKLLSAYLEAAKLMKKTYFSGGTVAASIADMDFVKHRDGIEELFEDGTASFLSIASISHGFRILNDLTTPSISRHTSSLARYLRRMLLSLKHENGADVCVLYGGDNKVSVNMGPTVSFNLKRLDGSWFGYREVEKLASLSGIQLRTGCFCNPGACAKYLGLSHLELLSNVEAGHICWDDFDIVNGKPTGAVRVSFGYMSTFEEAKRFVDFITSSFVTLPSPLRHGFHLREREIDSMKGQERANEAVASYLKSIAVYPIKSCAGFSVDSWPLSSTGLLHDREWLLKSPSGEILTQKKVPEMSRIRTSIDLSRSLLFVGSSGCKTELQIPLESSSYACGREEIDLHGYRYEVHCYSHEVNSWFTKAIGRPCTLWRSSATNRPWKRRGGASMCRETESPLNFVNEAQFLLISEASVSDLNDRLRARAEISELSRAQAVEVSAMRFRPNLVISGGEPYSEDFWRRVQIGNNYFESLGGCNRCQMINFDQQSEQIQKTSEPLATLASYRRMKGRILFGILLQYEKSDMANKEVNSWLQVGEAVHPEMR